MPVCFKCSAENPGSNKYCSACGAVLPQMAPTGVPATSSLDVDENTEYLSPQFHYPAEELLNLAWAANDFLEEGAELEPFLESYEIVREKFLNYQRDYMQDFQNLIADDRARDPDDPYPKQVTYLHNKGINLVDEGLAGVDGFLEALDRDQILPEKIKDGVVKLVMANDHFCLLISLLQARAEVLKETLKGGGITLNEEGEMVFGTPPPGSNIVADPQPAAVQVAEAGDDE